MLLNRNPPEIIFSTASKVNMIVTTMSISLSVFYLSPFGSFIGVSKARVAAEKRMKKIMQASKNGWNTILEAKIRSLLLGDRIKSEWP